jgi:hypothetical protein
MIKLRPNYKDVFAELEKLYDSLCSRQMFAQKQIAFYQNELLKTNIQPFQKTHMRGQLKIWSDEDNELLYQRIDLYRLINKVADFQPNYHECKYCNNITHGNESDLLCDDCKETFGHSSFTEL